MYFLVLVSPNSFIVTIKSLVSPFDLEFFFQDYLIFHIIIFICSILTKITRIIWVLVE